MGKLSQWFALTIVDFVCVEKHLIKARPYFVYNEQGEQLFVLIKFTCIFIYVKMNCTLYHWIEILSTTFKQNWIKKLEDCLHQQYCYAFFPMITQNVIQHTTWWNRQMD